AQPEVIDTFRWGCHYTCSAVAFPHARPSLEQRRLASPMSLHHYLRPLLMPTSVALVGASERADSLGRVVLENLLGASYTGDVYAVNPNHRRVLGQKSWPSISSIGKPIDLVLIAVRYAEVPAVLEQAARAGTRAAVVLSTPPLDEGDGRRWRRDLTSIAHRRRI